MNGADLRYEFEDRLYYEVTGGARGIGQAYCLGLARSGAKVVVADVRDTQETVAKVKQTGTDALGLSVDVASFNSVQHMVHQATDTFQQIDILVNNAALMAGLHMGAFANISEDEWDRVMAVNGKGIWHCIKAVTPCMQQQHYGKIINISSTTVLMGVPGLTQSEAIKEMSAASEELGEMSKQLAAQAALGREQYPEDLVGTVVFLASTDSDFITGQNFTVDGGVVHW